MRCEYGGNHNLLGLLPTNAPSGRLHVDKRRNSRIVRGKDGWHHNMLEQHNAADTSNGHIHCRERWTWPAGVRISDRWQCHLLEP